MKLGEFDSVFCEKNLEIEDIEEEIAQQESQLNKKTTMEIEEEILALEKVENSYSIKRKGNTSETKSDDLQEEIKFDKPVEVIEEESPQKIETEENQKEKVDSRFEYSTNETFQNI